MAEEEKKAGNESDKKEVLHSEAQDGGERLKVAGLILIPIVVAAIILSMVGVGVLQVPTGTSNSQTTPWGGSIQISTADFGPSVTVYYFSWYGCPFGATDSWPFYQALSQYLNANLSQYVVQHYSISAPGTTGIPGLLFSSFSMGGLSFDAIYYYNQTMTGSTTNAPIAKSDLVPYAANEINGSVPAAIAALDYHWMGVVNLAGNNSSSYFHFSTPHVNSNMIIAGPHGAWLFNGPIYNPQIIESYTPAYLLQNMGTIVPSSAVTSILDAIHSVS